MFSTFAYIWLGALVLFIIIEAIIPGLVCIWFALGALVALIASLLHAPFWLQGVLFVLVSVITLVLTRPLAKRYVNGKIEATNADAVVGKECLVTSKIDNILGTGRVKVGGQDWSAKSYSDDISIESGTRALVEKIEGVKLIVKPIAKEEEK